MADDKYKFGGEFPIGFSMALAHNVNAFKTFLSLSDNEQDEIVKKAREAKGCRDMQLLVNNIGLHGANKNNSAF